MVPICWWVWLGPRLRGDGRGAWDILVLVPVHWWVRLGPYTVGCLACGVPDWR